MGHAISPRGDMLKNRVRHRCKDAPCREFRSFPPNCQFCHGIGGDGRGDPRSPGRAANLHETHLNRDQLVEVIACGRPGTEMPHFDKYAYEDTDRYGLKGKNLGNDAARDPHSTSLTKREIEAVVDYILAKFVGK
jgi:hypothetical protein